MNYPVVKISKLLYEVMVAYNGSSFMSHCAVADQGDPSLEIYHEKNAFEFLRDLKRFVEEQNHGHPIVLAMYKVAALDLENLFEDLSITE